MCQHKHKHKHKSREKELAKLKETDEEKRARRQAKKAAKALKREEQSQVGGYTNEANPWNDPNLSEQFAWGKKQEKDRARGIPDFASKEAQKRKREELEAELRKVKYAREQREAEKEAFEEERRMLDREREQMAFVDNEKREDEFQFAQSKERAKIRSKEGRARSIDLVCESLTLFDDGMTPERALEIELMDPMTVFHHLSVRELRELDGDIASYGELDLVNEVFWDAMRHMCKHQLHAAESRGRHVHGMHAEVQSDIDNMLSGKSCAELDKMHKQITQRLQSDEDVDTDYWESVLVRLRLANAKAALASTYKNLRRRRAEICRVPDPSTARAPSAVEAEGHRPPEPESAAQSSRAEAKSSGRYSPELLPEEEVDYEDEASDDEGAGVRSDSEAIDVANHDSGGRYSPVLLSAQEINRDEAVDEAEDFRQLQAQRARVKSRSMDKLEEPADGSERLIQAEKNKGMDAGEARFSFEVPLEQKVAWWHDKYRPRKPKYFNRVHTGYEWNKYNQTHYDHDNPPPKMVQGYKFNVFYPDLIDRTQTPSYVLLPDPSGAKDTCILRFHGGPPYEDCAFKIVNREWETSHKRGFRCKFERGILQLYFNFKRYRYRR
mmetsp:Transcript_44369/g.73606  ORF Transcript_44369/g.73606 Transcript_44369/m.73606 type:complete len:610 (-) Transcript_44369:413-2242(-)